MVTSPGNIHEYTVSELSFALKRTVEGEYALVRVRGELSGVKRHSSGHLYCTLKDEKAALDGVCWRSIAARLPFKPEDGLEVVATGKLSTYPARSKYQLVIEQMEPAGAGALMALLEERKKKLAAEGLFDPARKRPLPFLPEVIGVVTSPTGAVIRDILHRLADRFPRHVLLWPVPVQGEGAAEKIAAAIAGFNRLADEERIPRPDVMIVARGGGSIEDLWAFNEEVVVRAVADSRIPVISAVGHETDTTLIDHAADRRAPTPTAAAEIAVPVRGELLARLAELDSRRLNAWARLSERRRERVAHLARALPRPRDLVGLARQRLDDLGTRLPQALRAHVRAEESRLLRLSGALTPHRLRQHVLFERRRAGDLARRLTPAMRQRLADSRGRVEAAGRLLESMSYRAVLARGYAVLRDDAGQPVTRAAALTAGMHVTAELVDGRKGLVVEGTPGARPPRRRDTRAAEAPKQQRLF
ncbi:MAG: exodeoxyribonuclease VII large subunit [Alphaproteobacteria bacterium]|nr:MAG: exodeoxyribonuclease VII large subunit [Alphaproteobacteria bacterium]